MFQPRFSMHTPKKPRKVKKPKSTEGIDEREPLRDDRNNVPDPLKPADPVKLSHSGLWKLLRENLGGSIFLRDRSFQFVDPGQMQLTANLILKQLSRKGILYGPKFDCDDFTLKLIAELSIVYAMKEATAEGFAAGILFYTDQTVGPHARIWYVDSDQELRFFEAMTAQPAELSEDERQSAWLVFG
jgi:hypothetical protein